MMEYTAGKILYLETRTDTPVDDTQPIKLGAVTLYLTSWQLWIKHCKLATIGATFDAIKDVNSKSFHTNESYFIQFQFFQIKNA